MYDDLEEDLELSGGLKLFGKTQPHKVRSTQVVQCQVSQVLQRSRL